MGFFSQGSLLQKDLQSTFPEMAIHGLVLLNFMKV